MTNFTTSSVKNSIHSCLWASSPLHVIHTWSPFSFITGRLKLISSRPSPSDFMKQWTWKEFWWKIWRKTNKNSRIYEKYQIVRLKTYQSGKSGDTIWHRSFFFLFYFFRVVAQTFFLFDVKVIVNFNALASNQIWKQVGVT